MALKKTILFPVLFVIISIFPDCSKEKNCTPVPPSSETAQILAYASLKGMNGTTHSSGVYYEIISQGSGATASANSQIFITYVGKMLNDDVFDEQTSVNTKGWQLSGLIEGWQIGIPLIQKGGRIKLIIPSALAYKCKPYGTLPANSILFFDITLVDIQ
jgi:FKBP-type peptidyl-prolyl cis-trans isomerase FkpA